jgi:hypothetical protein
LPDNYTIDLFAERVLFFTPSSIGNDSNQFDLIVSRFFPVTARWSITPRFRVYYDDSNQGPEQSFSWEPELLMSYQLSENFDLYWRSQYRHTEFLDSNHGSVEVFQGTVGLSAKF